MKRKDEKKKKRLLRKIGHQDDKIMFKKMIENENERMSTINILVKWFDPDGRQMHLTVQVFSNTIDIKLNSKLSFFLIWYQNKKRWDRLTLIELNIYTWEL